ncbi:threonine/serine exporter family protein [Diplocloster modestus]|uniref:Threonine/serine exporter family protein n=1 Tax=Diplocloster modestus TaxID=2850322 RepID=A0ABS6K462_9FIRM|nr:threonine/serine exporter family protein [Diplocloster modestus]
MDYQSLTDTAVLAGEIMLKNNAETYRCEETINHMLKAQKPARVEAVVLTTSILVTASDRDMNPITVVRRIKNRDTNLNRICRVNEISRRFCAGALSLKETREELMSVSREKIYRPYLVNLCLVLVSIFYTMLLGGHAIDCVNAAVCGILMAAMTYGGSRLGLRPFIRDFCICAAIAVCACAVGRFLPVPVHLDLIIIATMMPMMPGVAVTNAARDTLQGDYMSGGARMLEAFVKALAIALGVGLGLGICGLFGWEVLL